MIFAGKAGPVAGTWRLLRGAARAAVLAVILGAFPGPSPAAEPEAVTVGADTRVEFSPPAHFVPGRRIRVEAEVADDAGIRLVRCYFRAAGAGPFVFVAMEHDRRNRFEGVLPAPAEETGGIELIVLTLNADNRVFRTDPVLVPRSPRDKIPPWQEVSGKKPILVSTETGPAVPPAGFTDAVVAESSSGWNLGGISKISEATEPFTNVVSHAGGGSPTPSGSRSSLQGSQRGAAVKGSAGIPKAALYGLGAAAAVGGGVLAASALSGGDEEGATPCNQVVQQGGDTPETHRVNLGKKSGEFGFAWDMQNVKDRMRVSYEGSTLFDTGCVSGTGRRFLTFSGGSRVVTVAVTPNCAGPTSGTVWAFQVTCP